MQTKAISTGASLASCCASVTCSARTATENSATSLAWVTRRPCFLMCSTCSGHGSMKVTSSPACTICAPAYPPTAPAPTIAILRPMVFPPCIFVRAESNRLNQRYPSPPGRTLLRSPVGGHAKHGPRRGGGPCPFILRGSQELAPQDDG